MNAPVSVQKRVIAVIGANHCDERTAKLAEEVGRLLAQAGCTVLTGGLGGVMQAASRGARSAGGLVLAVLPGDEPHDANAYVDLAIATGIGDARNAIIANTAEAFVALPGSYGTLSEMAYALKRGKRVVSLGAPHIEGPIVPAQTPEQAVREVLGAGAA